MVKMDLQDIANKALQKLLAGDLEGALTLLAPAEEMQKNFIDNFLLTLYHKYKDLENLIAPRYKDSHVFWQYKASHAFNAGAYMDSIKWWRRAIKLLGPHKNFYFNIAMCLIQLRDYKKAIKQLKKCITLGPNVDVYKALGDAYHLWNKCDIAQRYYNQALCLAPNDLNVKIDRAQNLLRVGRMHHAIAIAEECAEHTLNTLQKHQLARILQKCVSLPALEKIKDRYDSVENGDLSFIAASFMQDLSYLTQEQVNSYGKRWADSIPIYKTNFVKRSGGIRLGFMSPDLRDHAVMRFLKPMLDHIDRAKFTLVGISTTYLADKLHSDLFDEFYDAPATDAELAKMASGAGCDIMFDIAGHTMDNRCHLFKSRLSPIQISWLGYPNISGIQEIDYFLGDKHLFEGVDLPMKKLAHPSVNLCAAGLDWSFWPDKQIPLEVNGHPTFGSMISPYKVTAQTLDMWAHVLKAIPGSRFVYVRPELTTRALRTNLERELAARGVADRLNFIVNPGGKNMPFYGAIDISLDTLPMTGGTNTIEALWMGVPVLTIPQNSLQSRLTHSYVSSIEAGEWSCTSLDGVVQQVHLLLDNPQFLRECRTGLRDHMTNYAILDAKRWTAEFEQLLCGIL